MVADQTTKSKAQINDSNKCDSQEDNAENSIGKQDVKPKSVNENDQITKWLTNICLAYFSVGGSADISHEFHRRREANKEKYNTTLKNKMGYAWLGTTKRSHLNRK
eukprot:UN32648